MGMQRETLAEGLEARQGFLESLRFEQNWEKAVSHCRKCNKLLLGEKHGK